MNSDRIASLKSLLLQSLDAYRGGFADLELLDRDMKSLLYSFDEVADPEWAAGMRGLWIELEIIYASSLDAGAFHISPEDSDYVSCLIGEIRAELEKV